MNSYIELQIVNVDMNWDFLGDKIYNDIQWHGGCIHFAVNPSQTFDFSTIENEELKISDFNIGPESFWSVIVFIPEFQICILWDVISKENNIFSSSYEFKITKAIHEISQKIINYSHAEYDFYIISDKIEKPEIEDFCNFLKNQDILNLNTLRELELEVVRRQLNNTNNGEMPPPLHYRNDDCVSMGYGSHYPSVYDSPHPIVDEEKVDKSEELKSILNSNKDVVIQERKLRIDYPHAFEENEYIVIWIERLIKETQKWETAQYMGNFNISNNLKVNIVNIDSPLGSYQDYLKIGFDNIIEELFFIQEELKSLGVNEVHFERFLNNMLDLYESQKEGKVECKTEDFQENKFNKYEID